MNDDARNKIGIMILLMLSMISLITMLIGIWFFPVYVIISFFVWIAITIALICFCKKLNECIWLIVFTDIIFTFILMSSIGEDDKIMLIEPSFSILALCFLGKKMLGLKEKYKLKKARVMAKVINTNIDYKLKGVSLILNLVNTLYDKKKIIELVVKLLNSCTESDELINCYKHQIEKQQKKLFEDIEIIKNEYKLQTSINSELFIDIVVEYERMQKELEDEKIGEMKILLEDYSNIKLIYKKYCKNNIFLE